MTSRLLRRRLKEQVVVTLKSGATFSGVLTECDRHVWILRNAASVGPPSNGAIVDGELILRTEEIDYCQRP